MTMNKGGGKKGRERGREGGGKEGREGRKEWREGGKGGREEGRTSNGIALRQPVVNEKILLWTSRVCCSLDCNLSPLTTNLLLPSCAKIWSWQRLNWVQRPQKCLRQKLLN